MIFRTEARRSFPALRQQRQRLHSPHGHRCGPRAPLRPATRMGVLLQEAGFGTVPPTRRPTQYGSRGAAVTYCVVTWMIPVGLPYVPSVERRMKLGRDVYIQASSEGRVGACHEELENRPERSAFSRRNRRTPKRAPDGSLPSPGVTAP